MARKKETKKAKPSTNAPEKASNKDVQVTEPVEDLKPSTPTTVEPTSETSAPAAAGVAVTSTKVSTSKTVTKDGTDDATNETEGTATNATDSEETNGTDGSTKKRKHENNHKFVSNKKKEEDPNKPKPILGKPVSGRSWKVREQKRVSTMIVGDEGHPSRWGTSQEKEKERRKKVQAIEAEVKSKRKAEAEAKRKSIEANKQRHKEKQLRATTVQIVKDPRKIKKMSRKRQKLFSQININELEFTRVV